MESHCVGQRDPSQEIAHPAIFGWLEDKVPVVGHQLVRQNSAGLPIQSLREDAFEGVVVLRRVKHRGPRVGTIQRVIDPARLVRTSWSSHTSNLAAICCLEKSPDTFSLARDPERVAHIDPVGLIDTPRHDHSQ
jgi:hypothetical protein